MFYGVILSGGRGERLWPVNRWDYPKHLLAPIDGESMLEKSIRRIESLVAPKHVIIVTHQNFAGAIKEHLHGRLEVGDLIVEPEGKNTAVAIGLAALKLLKQNPNAIMFVLPADHHVGEEDRWLQALRTAARLTLEGDNFVTIGVNPTRPEPSYGYIEMGKPLVDQYEVPVFRMAGFKEKPTKEEAVAFLARGKYLWNSGMYVWRADSLMDALKQHMPELHGGLMAIADDLGTERELDALRGLYTRIGNVSIDYGIMEKVKGVLVIRGSFLWEDFADWETVARVQAGDAQGNVTRGTTVTLDSHSNLVWCEDGVVATLGVQDLIVVKKQNAVLVCRRNRAEDVKNVVAELREKGLSELA